MAKQHRGSDVEDNAAAKPDKEQLTRGVTCHQPVRKGEKAKLHTTARRSPQAAAKVSKNFTGRIA